MPATSLTLAFAAASAEGETTGSLVLNVVAPKVTSTMPGVVFRRRPAASFVLDKAGSFTIGTSSAAGADVQLVDPDDLPDGLTFTDNGDGTATVSGTPLTAGTANVTIVATGVLGASSVQVVTLNVAVG